MCSVAKPAVEVLSADTQQVVLKPRIPQIPFYFLVLKFIQGTICLCYLSFFKYSHMLNCELSVGVLMVVTMFSKNLIFKPQLLFQISKMSLSVSAPEILKTPMSIPEKTLLGPGPSNVPDRVLKAMTLPTIGHLHPEFTKVINALFSFTSLYQANFFVFTSFFRDFSGEKFFLKINWL